MADLLGTIVIEVFDNGQLRMELPEGPPVLTERLFAREDQVPEHLRAVLMWQWFSNLRIGGSNVGIFVGIHDSPARAFSTAADVFRTLDGSR